MKKVELPIFPAEFINSEPSIIRQIHQPQVGSRCIEPHEEQRRNCVELGELRNLARGVRKPTFMEGGTPKSSQKIDNFRIKPMIFGDPPKNHANFIMIGKNYRESSHVVNLFLNMGHFWDLVSPTFYCNPPLKIVW